MKAVGVGVNALLSKYLGEKDYDQVNKAVNNGMIFIVLVVLYYLLKHKYFK